MGKRGSYRQTADRNTEIPVSRHAACTHAAGFVDLGVVDLGLVVLREVLVHDVEALLVDL